MSPGPDVAAVRLTSQLLVGEPASTPEGAVSHLLAVQGQDARGVRLAVRARTTNTSTAHTTAADIDAALTERRTLLITWLNRGTLHLVTADDYWWLHPLTTPQLATGSARRLSQTGVTPPQVDRAVEIVQQQVSDGPRTRSELRDALDAAGIPTAGQALIHLIYAAALRGNVIRGPMRGKEHCYVAVEQWLGPPPPSLDRDEALARLATRYLTGHGPATANDLATWAGITLKDARAGLSAINSTTVRRDDDLVDLADRTAPAQPPEPRLLGAFEPVLLGWSDREWLVGSNADLIAVGGVFRPFALVDGKAAATWGLSGNRITIRPFRPLREQDQSALAQDARRVLRFLGLPEREAAFEQPAFDQPQT